jgi:YD repeat-containing protein
MAPLTPFGTAAGQTGGFNGSFQPSLPLYHVGGRGEAGVDLVWNFQPNWQAYKQFGGTTPFVAIDPYPDGDNIATGSSPSSGTFGLGAAGAVYARTGANYTYCSSGTYSGSSVPSSTVTHLVFVGGTGTEIDLQDTATGGAAHSISNPCSNYWTTTDAGRKLAFSSQDGSVLQFTADSNVLETNPMGAYHGGAPVSGYLRFPSGVTYRIDGSSVSWIQDRNGNRVSFSYVQASSKNIAFNWFLSGWAPTQITDAIGRTITINYSDTTCGGCTTVSYPGVNGTSREIKIITTGLSSALHAHCTAQTGPCALKTIDGLFPGTGQSTYANYNPTVASSIQLPDGSQYSFQYNSYGELARVNLRTGGAIEFDYGDANNNVNNGGGSTGDGFVGNASDGNPVMVYRRLLARRDYPDGSTLAATTDFSAATTGSGSSEITTETDTVYDAGSNAVAQTKHWYNGNPTDALTVGGTGCNAWNEGFEYETDYGTPTVLRTVARQLAAQTGCLNNPKVQTVTTTNDAKQVSQTTFAYDQYGNVTDKKEYD